MFQPLILPSIISFALTTLTAATVNSAEITRNNALNFVRRSLVGTQKPFLLSNPDSLIAEEIEYGITNYCYRVYDSTEVSRSVFVKHAKDTIKGWSDIPLTSTRLQYERDGLIAFSKYAGEFLPKVLVYDDVSNHLVNEWLDGYVPLLGCFVRGSFDASYARKMGTLMGRSHARTHRDITPDKADLYRDRFSNHEHIHLWRTSMFAPLQDMLSRGAVEELGVIGVDQSELLDIVCRLKDVYSTKKEALVHGDLNCNNVLIAMDEAADGFKVVDFEKCFYGPSGLDLGIFLSNYLWYYAAQPNPANRRSLSGGASAVLEAYKSAFTVQGLGVLRTVERNSPPSSVDDSSVMDDIMRDTSGFMGLYPLFLLTVIPEVAPSIWPLEEVTGMNFGNKEDRRKAVRLRQLRMAATALRLFAGPERVTLQRIVALLTSDDQFLTTSQLTEFWF